MPTARKKGDRLGVTLGWNNTRVRRTPRAKARRGRWWLCVLGVVSAVMVAGGLLYEFVF